MNDGRKKCGTKSAQQSTKRMKKNEMDLCVKCDKNG